MVTAILTEVASSTNFPFPSKEGADEDGGEGYDLIAFFDSLHDMEDPQGAVAHVLTTIVTV
jgi:hypothetical protein